MTPPLREGADDLAQFASDLAACGEPINARSLAECYLDQNIDADKVKGCAAFEAAVQEFIPQCAYYSDWENQQ